MTDLPKFIKSIKNGKLYTVGADDDIISVVHVWGEDINNSVINLIKLLINTGTPYEMGYAHGQLMKEKAQHLFDDVWAYMEQEIVCAILYLSHVQTCL